jgi:hypothetical protein
VNKIVRGECYHPRAVSLAFLIGRFRQFLCRCSIRCISTAAVHARSQTAHDVAFAALDAAVASGARS